MLPISQPSNPIHASQFAGANKDTFTFINVVTSKGRSYAKCKFKNDIYAVDLLTHECFKKPIPFVKGKEWEIVADETLKNELLCCIPEEIKQTHLIPLQLKFFKQTKSTSGENATLVKDVHTPSVVYAIVESGSIYKGVKDPNTKDKIVWNEVTEEASKNRIRTALPANIPAFPVKQDSPTQTASPSLKSPKFKDIFSTALLVNNAFLALLTAIIVMRDQVCKESKSASKKFFASIGVAFIAATFGLLSAVEAIFRTIALALLHTITLCGKPKWLIDFKVNQLALAPASLLITGRLVFHSLLHTWKYNTPIFKEKFIQPEDKKITELSGIKNPLLLLSKAKEIAYKSYPASLERSNK